jgi:hypothetical protein
MRGDMSRVIRQRPGCTHLGPLKRFLRSRVGKPWDTVFSEICAGAGRDVRLREALGRLVETSVVLLDGVPCSAVARNGQPSARLRPGLLFVCPRSGLLKVVKERAVRPNRTPNASAPYVRVDDRHQCRLINGAWHLVTLKRLPANPGSSGDRDVVLSTAVTSLDAASATRTYGAAVYAVATRRLGKHELRQYPIPLGT